MRTVTAAEAGRSFAALLDEAERGETTIVTRGGRRIATISPASAGNGADLIALLRGHRPDKTFARDVSRAREAVVSEEPA